MGTAIGPRPGEGRDGLCIASVAGGHEERDSRSGEIPWAAADEYELRIRRVANSVNIGNWYPSAVFRDTDSLTDSHPVASVQDAGSIGGCRPAPRRKLSLTSERNRDVESLSPSGDPRLHRRQLAR